MNIKLDTKMINNDGIEIKKLASQYKNEIDRLFSTLENMNNFGNVWVGESSDKYIKKIRQEKQKYYDLEQNFNDLADCLLYYSTDMDKCCNNIRSDINE